MKLIVLSHRTKEIPFHRFVDLMAEVRLKLPQKNILTGIYFRNKDRIAPDVRSYCTLYNLPFASAPRLEQIEKLALKSTEAVYFLTIHSHKWTISKHIRSTGMKGMQYEQQRPTGVRKPTV